MPDIPRFTAEAPRRGSLEPDTRTGAPEALASIAQSSSALARQLGQAADAEVQRRFTEAGAASATSVAMPSVDFAFDKPSGSSSSTAGGGSAKPYKTSDPVATDLPAYARAFLNATAGGESGGAYNVRYTPGGAAYFSDLSRHPRIFENGPHGRTSAAGRYQFTATTWDSVGGGDFSEANQDRRAWQLAQRDYRSNTGRDLGADLQAGGLTPQILGSLSGTWAAFKSNRSRHIATYQASLARFGADPVTTSAVPAAAPATAAPPAGTEPAAPVSPGGVRVTLTGTRGELKLMKPGTLAGDAYNKAASGIYVNRLDTAMRGQMDALAVQYQDDPAGLQQALDAARAGFTDDLPPAARAAIHQSFEQARFGLMREAATRYQRQIESQNLASFEENIEARTRDAWRVAASGGLDAEADAVLSRGLGALSAQIDASSMTPLQKQQYKQKAADQVLEARVLGGMEGQPDEAGRAAYVKKFQDDWTAGTGPTAGMTAAQYQAVNSRLVSRLNQDEVAARKRDAAAGQTITEQTALMKKGYPVPSAVRDRLRSDIAGSSDPALLSRMDQLDGLANWQAAHIGQRPEMIAARIAETRARMTQDGATPAAMQALEVMEGLHEQMTKGLATDPLTWAARAGVAQIEPLDFSDGPRLTATLSERAADAAAVAGHYGIQPKFFTAAEAEQVKKQVIQAPLTLPSLVSAIDKGLSTNAPQALSEISKDAPLLAHLGGLYHLTDDQAPVVEIASMLDARQKPGYKSALPTAGKIQAATATAAGAAFLALPGTQTGATQAAMALMEYRATTRGISMEDFDKPDSASRRLYDEALDQVLGATFRDGVKFGGLAEVNGRLTIAPPDMPADGLQTLLDNLTSDDMLFQQAPASANGVPITLSQIRSGQLVAVGMGRYRVALGDIEGGDPRYVGNAAGGYLELDAAMLQRSQKARPAETATGRRRRTIEEWGNQFSP